MSHDDDSNGPDSDPAGERSRPRKEKVLHARISDTLDEEIRDRAERLGISVSNLVRNVLENTLGVVDDIVADTSRVARSARGVVRGDSGRARVTPPAKTLGWQEFTLSVNAVCAECNEILAKGSRAAVEVADRGAPREVRCLPCAEGEE